jgi:uncharacterized protein YjeT (DUF2065 family)
MEPVAIVTAFVAALYIVGKGPLLVAPAATAAFYRRLLSTRGRVRIFGSLLVLLAAALIVTARQAREAQGGITILIEGFGWITAASAVWTVAASGSFQRLMDAFYAPPNEPLRAFGAFGLVAGLVFGMFAFSVM